MRCQISRQMTTGATITCEILLNPVPTFISVVFLSRRDYDQSKAHILERLQTFFCAGNNFGVEDEIRLVEFFDFVMGLLRRTPERVLTTCNIVFSC